MFEIIGRLFIAVTYLVAVIVGTLVGCLIWAFIGAFFFELLHINAGSYILFVGFCGGGLTCLHFVKHWEFYFHLQRLKRLHRIKYRCFSNIFVESVHTVGDIIFTLTYLVADGVVPWVFLGVFVVLAGLVTHAVVPGWGIPGALGFGFVGASLAFELGTKMVEAVFNITKLQDELDHNIDL